MDTKFKSDKQAKEAVVQHLVEKGFKDVKIVKSPSDIIAMKDGVQWYFEVKMTSHRDRYFEQQHSLNGNRRLKLLILTGLSLPLKMQNKLVVLN